MVSNGAMGHPTQCIPRSRSRREARGDRARTFATESSPLTALDVIMLSALIVPNVPSLRRRKQPRWATALRRRQVVSDRDEGVRLGQDNALPAAPDNALAFPRAQEAADGVQRGAGHLGDVLT